jgi:hypothetical protein
MRTNLLIFLFLLIAKIGFCQQDMSIIHLGDKIIWLPIPENDMAELGDSLRKMAEIQVPPNNLLKAAFLPKDVIEKLGIEPVNDRKKVMIEIVKSLEQKDVSETDFKSAVDYMKKSFPSDLPDITKKTNQLFENMKDRIGRTEIGKMEILGTILESKDSFAYLMDFKHLEDNKETIVYAGLLVIRIKNRMLLGYFYNYADYDEAVAWISKIIPIWCKKVFDLNPDISLTPKREISNSSQQAITKNEISSDKNRSNNSITNLFSSLFDLFKTLVIKAPLTLFFLIILIVSYYIGSRKLYIKIMRKPTQPSAYVNFAKSKSSRDNKLLWLFLGLIEFIIVIVLLLSLLKLIGFKVPSEVL